MLIEPLPTAGLFQRRSARVQPTTHAEEERMDSAKKKGNPNTGANVHLLIN